MKANGTMIPRRIAAAVMVLGLAAAGCDYIVPPIDFNTATPPPVDNGWAGMVTDVADASGSLHVGLSIVNNTGDWSAMNVSSTKAKVTDSSGQSHDCGSVFVGTAVFVNDSGTYVPPGFVMKGYTGGSLAKPETQLLGVECAGVSKSSADKLAISYSYITGPFNYYVSTKPKQASMSLDLKKVVADTQYPIAKKVDSLVISKPGEALQGINDCTVTLADVKRTDAGFEFTWDSTNPTQYPAYIHIGQPPVLGADGIVYGFYQSPHLADVPITPSGGTATWTTKVAVPPGTSGFYILLPLETHSSKFFVHHVIDITSK
jgi:hypothetical protein